MTEPMMHAVQIHSAGGPEVLRYEQVTRPELQPGEVLVRVHAIGLNPPDWYVREGMTNVPEEWRPVFSYPLILGSDISGVIDAVAPDVTDFEPGDEVFGLIRFPDSLANAYAEFVAAPATDLARKPASIDHVHAAAAPMAGLTAWQFLIERGHDTVPPFQAELHHPVPLHEGTRVMINGAAGGVGHIAVQLAKWKGAHVLAVASGAHRSFLEQLGADEVLDYTVTSPEDSGEVFDLVLDSVGGADTGRFIANVTRGGALFPVFFGPVDPERAAAEGVYVSSTQVRASGAQLAELAELLDTGTVRVAIDSTYPLADAQLAHERAAEGHLQGKIVLTVA
ncbi:NADP-dependent oxidoreductase [Curtobacterium sp. VKM Ac-1376]|uniref:NADP-dependent oxidoreductase n=1 Tax=Curtobacterium sp. VKM Ac-1376 TaxID=123312 RepID=UPI001E322E22|nr:NADP-dependent oxidoreductase [Curtobacterium sp. VKM Ac-1376]